MSNGRAPSSDEEALAILLRATPDYLGKFGEAIWKRVLANSGWHYISLANIEDGGAPMARGNGGNIILPDFDAFRDGESVYVEAKAKTQSIRFRKANQERHGINERNWNHYRQIERTTGKPCCIAIVELQSEQKDQSLKWSGEILIEKVSNLIPLPADFYEPVRKIYWSKKNFINLDYFSPLELFQLARGELRRAYTSEIGQMLHPQIQKELFA